MGNLSRILAIQDLDDHIAYIAENNFEAALKFFDLARLTVAQLARMPGMGSLYPVKKSSLAGTTEMSSEGFQEVSDFLL